MAGGGGAWKVAYADFVTAMMAFFMVMWLVSQNAKVRVAIAEHFREPDAMSVFSSTKSGNAAGRDRRGRKYGKSSGTNQVEALDESNLKNSRAGTSLKTDASGVSFSVPFAENQADLDDEILKRVDKLLPLVLGKTFKLEIRGHSSRRPLPEGSPYKDPWELCYHRCLVVMNHLVDQGVQPERIRISQAGIFEPRSNEPDAKSEASNARVEVTMLSEVAAELHH